MRISFISAFYTRVAAATVSHRQGPRHWNSWRRRPDIIPVKGRRPLTIPRVPCPPPNRPEAKSTGARGGKAYSYISDLFPPFATQTVPATVHEATCILNGLLMNEDRKSTRRHRLLHRPCLRRVLDPGLHVRPAHPRPALPSKRLYVFERSGVPNPLRPLVGGKVNAGLIDRNWTDILRGGGDHSRRDHAAEAGLCKLAAYPRACGAGGDRGPEFGSVASTSPRAGRAHAVEQSAGLRVWLRAHPCRNGASPRRDGARGLRAVGGYPRLRSIAGMWGGCVREPSPSRRASPRDRGPPGRSFRRECDLIQPLLAVRPGRRRALPRQPAGLPR